MLSKRTSALLKKIAGIAFAVAFIMAIVLFGGIGRQYISIFHAKIIFMVAGAIGLVLNLLSFETGKHSPLFNLLYWLGSIILFIGLVFLQLRLPYGFYVVVAGLIILGLSFVLPSNLVEPKTENEDLLDSPD